MASPSAYQYIKLGSNLEMLRGLCSASLMQTTSLVAFPNLMENLPQNRYSVSRVTEALKAVLIQLEELNLSETLHWAQSLGPMVREMEQYLAQTPGAETAFLHDKFADHLVGLCKELMLAVKRELSSRAP